MTVQEIKQLAYQFHTLSQEESELFQMFLEAFAKGFDDGLKYAKPQPYCQTRPPQEISVEKYVGLRIKQI